MTALTIEEYRVVELHYYNLDSYVSNYSNSQIILEKGSDSKRNSDKLLKLKEYRQMLSNYLHKQSRLVFPTLSELRND